MFNTPKMIFVQDRGKFNYEYVKSDTLIFVILAEPAFNNTFLIITIFLKDISCTVSNIKPSREFIEITISHIQRTLMHLKFLNVMNFLHFNSQNY